MTEDWRNSIDNKEAVAAVALDFSKAFDAINHRLLLAKLKAYGLTLRAARSIFVHAPGILNFHGDTHKLDSSNYKALVLTHFLAHLRCAH